jgi:hypothetical protein
LKLILWEGDRMPSGSAAIQPQSEHRRLGCLLSVTDRLRGWTARLPRANPRIATSVTLLAVVVSAAPALMPQRAATTAQSETAAPGGAPAVPAVPVKIVGAVPRSDNCAEQVWPYIEQRCLTRAADRPKTSAHARAAAGPPSGARATVGAAPDGDAGRQSPVADDAKAPTADLPSQVAAKEPVDLPIPPGAVPLRPAPSADKQPSLGREGMSLGTEPMLDGRSIGEPRRRIGRHAYRSRHGRLSSRRSVFAFPF